MPKVAAVTRARDTYPVQRVGGKTVVTLPEHIDMSNADEISEQLLSLINRGAAELIADMTATLSCDHAGVDAVVRAYQRAIIKGTQLRLVVTGQMVRRMLAVNGLDRLIPICPSLEAAVAAGAKRPERRVGPRTAAITPAVPEAASSPRAADQTDRAEELLDWVVASILDVGVILEAASDLPRDAAGLRVAEALHRLDGVVREVRHHMFAERAQGAESGFAQGPPLDTHQRLVQAANRVASLQECVVQTAHTLQSAAADTAALLEHQASLAGQPARIDYPTEIKRWQAFADQAKQMAKRWEQQPFLDSRPETGQGPA